MPPFVCPVGGSCGEGSGGEDDGSDGGSGNGSSVDTTCVRGYLLVYIQPWPIVSDSLWQGSLE